MYKKRAQISHVSVITIVISVNNSKKLDESWTWMSWKLLNFLKYTTQFLHFNLIESI